MKPTSNTICQRRNSRRHNPIFPNSVRPWLLLTAFAPTAFVTLGDNAVGGLVGPSPYLQASDSPFASLTFNYFHRENFEDGLFNVPGVTKSTGNIIGPGPAADSVDADDGTIDGSGNGGRSLFVISSQLTLTFDAITLGRLPTHAGIVRTDGGPTAGFEAFGPGMIPLGTIGPVPFGDGNPNGGTAEDRFFGWSDPNGILAIRIPQDVFEVDHLQYGFAAVVPEPTSLILIGLGLLTIAMFNRRRAHRLARAAVLSLAAWSAPVNAAQPFFVGLGDLPGGTFSSYATAVSADGSVVVGGSSSTPGGQAFRWTQNGGMVGLGDLPGANFYSVANSVSDDGTVVVGHSNAFLQWTVGGYQPRPGAFRWTQMGGMTLLGTYGVDNTASASAVSADGSVVVGGTSYHGGFRWTQNTGMEFFPGDYGALGVSMDGSVVVFVGGGEVFRWTAGAGMISLGELGDLPGDTFYSGAYGVSRDGSVVVGWSDSGAALGYEAFRWTPNGGMVGLGLLPGYTNSLAYDVSTGGSIIVGYSGGPSDNEAFLWDAAHGMRNLRDVLVSDFGLGASLAGWTLEYARGISADGQFIVGSGINPSGNTEAWLARLPGELALPGDFNHDGTVDAADYVVWRNGLGTTYTQNDYDVWRAHFGQTAVGAMSRAALGSAQSPPRLGEPTVAVPEPTTLAILILAAAGFHLRRRHPGS